MKLSSLVVLFAASGDAKPTPEARAALKAKKNTQDLHYRVGKSNADWQIYDLGQEIANLRKTRCSFLNNILGFPYSFVESTLSFAPYRS